MTAAPVIWLNGAVEAMCLRVNPANAPALAPYTHHGFRRHGGTDDHPTMLATLRA